MDTPEIDRVDVLGQRETANIFVHGNNSAKGRWVHEDLVYIYAMCLVYTVGVCVAVIGNLVVIGVVARVFHGGIMGISGEMNHNNQNKHVYLYILSLSITDLCYASVTGPAVISQLLTNHFALGWFGCKAMYVVEGLNKTASLYLLVVLSMDRYMAVQWPTKSGNLRNVRFATYTIMCVLLLCVPAIVPLGTYAVLTDNVPHEITGMPNESAYLVCVLELPPYARNGSATVWYSFGGYYLLSLVLLYFLLPLSLLVFAYTSILRKMRVQQQRMGTGYVPVTTTPPHNNATDPTAFSSASAHQRARRTRITKIVAAVVACHVLCWSPYWSWQITVKYFGTALTEHVIAAPKIHYIASPIYALVYMNSAINPLLYAYLNKSLRQAYVRSTSAVHTKSKTVIVTNEARSHAAPKSSTNSQMRSASPNRISRSERDGSTSVRSRLLTVSTQRTSYSGHTESTTPTATHRLSATSASGGYLNSPRASHRERSYTCSSSINMNERNNIDTLNNQLNSKLTRVTTETLSYHETAF